LREITIELKGLDLMALFGTNHELLQLLKKHFSKLKIVQRGARIKAVGEEQELAQFEEKLNLLIAHLDKYNYLEESNVINLLGEKGADIVTNSSGSEILVYGNKGLKIGARTVNQRKMVSELDNNDMLFAIGPAGTGKTYTAVALAVRALKNKEVRRIILTRPAVEAGENLGFLPGDLKDKLDPYLQPLYDGLRDMIPMEKLSDFMEDGTIQIAPLAYMRGRTLDNAFVILDEGQNTTENQMKMFLTRMGKSAKFIITGDISQVDLPNKQISGLKTADARLSKIDGISFVYLDVQDVVRHKLVKSIITAFES
jgi:phosphate starvation-inducible PhoH-like protein